MQPVRGKRGRGENKVEGGEKGYYKCVKLVYGPLSASAVGRERHR